MSDRLWTIAKVASLLDISRHRAYTLARKGILPGVVRLGRQVRVDPDRLTAFIDSGGKPLPPTIQERRAIADLRLEPHRIFPLAGVQTESESGRGTPVRPG
jgi:predicted DNA-binding transcriptional regulator AlpA